MLTMYIMKACIVSSLVVLKKFALLSDASAPSFSLSTRTFLGNPIWRTADSLMLTTALNRAANTTP